MIITSQLVVCLLFLQQVLSFDDIIDGSINQTCNSAADNCYITCTTGYSCPDLNLHCPTNSDCNTCDLTCDGSNACARASIFGYECNLLNVTLVDGGHVGQNLKIHAPSNNGNASLTHLAEGGDKAFQNGIIYSKAGTNSIIVNIYESSGSGKEEAQNSIISGENANYVELNCYSGAECKETIVKCPKNSSLEFESSKIACLVNCTDANDCSINAYIEGGSWEDDISIECNGDTSCDAVVWCNNGTESCQMAATNTCNGLCQPTGEPTFVPTATTDVPSISPTLTPSVSPSNNPTANPTANPTVNPSNTPSDNPSNHPTNNPSTSPSKHPSSNPSRDPSGNPSIYPSNGPSKSPSSVPIAAPSGSSLSTTKTNDDRSAESNGGGLADTIESNFIFLVIVGSIIFIIILICCGVSICYFLRTIALAKASKQGENVAIEGDMRMSMDELNGKTGGGSINSTGDLYTASEATSTNDNRNDVVPRIALGMNRKDKNKTKGKISFLRSKNSRGKSADKHFDMIGSSSPQENSLNDLNFDVIDNNNNNGIETDLVPPKGTETNATPGGFETGGREQETAIEMAAFASSVNTGNVNNSNIMRADSDDDARESRMIEGLVKGEGFLRKARKGTDGLEVSDLSDGSNNSEELFQHQGDGARHDTVATLGSNDDNGTRRGTDDHES